MPARSIYNFAWHEFCDWYLEFIKPVIYGDGGEERAATQRVLVETLNRMLRLLHPFAPFITEEIYQKLPVKGESIMVDSYPTPENDEKWLSLGSEKSAEEIDLVKEVITAIRNIRGENRIKPGVKISVRLVPADDHTQKVLSANKTIVMTIGKTGGVSNRSGGFTGQVCRGSCQSGSPTGGSGGSPGRPGQFGRRDQANYKIY